ncbi:MAG: hypothetical protein IJR87_10160 [Bacteroidaceae bacterium]|nr:hypothetical protein [Bacteroidaceae bacterium]
MTYEEYQTAIAGNIEASRDTRRKQKEEQKDLELEMTRRMADAKRRYLEELESLRVIQRERAFAISEKWKTERMRLFTDHAKVIDQWRQEHGINCPPYVELPSGERPNEGGFEG